MYKRRVRPGWTFVPRDCAEVFCLRLCDNQPQTCSGSSCSATTRLRPSGHPTHQTPLTPPPHTSFVLSPRPLNRSHQALLPSTEANPPLIQEPKRKRREPKRGQVRPSSAAKHLRSSLPEPVRTSHDSSARPRPVYRRLLVLPLALSARANGFCFGPARPWTRSLAVTLQKRHLSCPYATEMLSCPGLSHPMCKATSHRPSWR